jgi:hypothetical protein
MGALRWKALSALAQADLSCGMESDELLMAKILTENTGADFYDNEALLQQ